MAPAPAELIRDVRGTDRRTYNDQRGALMEHDLLSPLHRLISDHTYQMLGVQCAHEDIQSRGDGMTPRVKEDAMFRGATDLLLQQFEPSLRLCLRCTEHGNRWEVCTPPAKSTAPQPRDSTSAAKFLGMPSIFGLCVGTLCFCPRG